MRWLTLPAFLTLLCGSAAGAKYTVRGIVVDVVSLQPISGAEVFLSGIPVAAATEPGGLPETTNKKTISSRSGTFSFELDVEGQFPIEARKEGYIPLRRRLEDADWVTVGGESEEVRLLLARQPRLSGCILDQESGKPVPALQVQALLAFYQDGRRTLLPVANRATSDSEGRFLFDSLLPGKYFLSVEADADIRESVMLSPSAVEQAKVDAGYLRATWPPLVDLEVALPFALDPGLSLDVGELLRSKGSAYRVHVAMRGDDCGAGGRMRINLYQSLGWLAYSRAVGIAPCRGEYLIRGLGPGTYEIEMWTEGPALDRQFAHAALEVLDRNLNRAVALTPGAKVAGTVVAPEHGALPTSLTVELFPLRGRHFSSDNKSPVKPDGNFSFAGLESAPHRIRLSGLGPGYFVKSMEYNGSAFEDGVVPLSQSSQSHSVVVTLGDGPATLRGRVTDSDEPVRGPFVVLTRWPVLDPYAQSQQIHGDREGRFTFSGLAPGNYRVIAVLEPDGDRLNEPGVLPWLLRKAKDVSLQERSIQSIDVEIWRP